VNAPYLAGLQPGTIIYKLIWMIRAIPRIIHPNIQRYNREAIAHSSALVAQLPAPVDEPATPRVIHQLILSLDR
jgi:hypothetical protein